MMADDAQLLAYVDGELSTEERESVEAQLRESAEARKKAELYFGDIPSGPTIKRQQAWVAKMSGTKRAMLQDRVPQARLYKT